MPVITYEEACRIEGVQPAECEARGRAEAQRWADAKLACTSAFLGHVKAYNTCYTFCGQSTRGVSECVVDLRQEAEAEHAHTVQLAHALSGAFAFFGALCFWALIRGKRRKT